MWSLLQIVLSNVVVVVAIFSRFSVFGQMRVHVSASLKQSHQTNDWTPRFKPFTVLLLLIIILIMMIIKMLMLLNVCRCAAKLSRH